jgi:hypothetical protein
MIRWGAHRVPKNTQKGNNGRPGLSIILLLRVKVMTVVVVVVTVLMTDDKYKKHFGTAISALVAVWEEVAELSHCHHLSRPYHGSRQSDKHYRLE